MKKLNQNKVLGKMTSRLISTLPVVALVATMAAIAAGSVLTSSNASAEGESQTSNVTVTVSEACTLSGVVDTAHTATLTPGTWTPGIGTTSITAICNDPGGYDIYAVGYSGNEWKNTNLINTSDDNLTIPTGTYSASATGSSYWSMQLAQGTGDKATIVDSPINFNNYVAVPNDYTKVATYPSLTAGTNGSSFTTTYGAYIASSQAAGTYEGKVKYTLVHPNGAAAPTEAVCSNKISGIKYMQDITSENKAAVLNSMTQNTQYSLQDNRDGKTYCVAKLADGNIWMTQNLDLEIGGSGVAALTSENTNLTTSGEGAYATDYTKDADGVITWTPNPANITPDGSDTNNTLSGSPATITNFASGSPDNSVAGWTNDSKKPYMAEGGDHYVYTSGSADTAELDTIYNSAQECVSAGHTSDQCAHYHVGNYYNWTAAIASSDSNGISAKGATAGNSICPAGWRLPKGLEGSTSSATTREFGQLWYAAGITSSLTATAYADGGFVNIRQDPLFFARGGLINGTKFYNGASYGGWWSSTVVTASSAYDAYFNGTGIYSAYYTSRRYYGSSVRCIVQ